MPIIIILLVLIIILLVTNIRVVPQATEFVIERLHHLGDRPAL